MIGHLHFISNSISGLSHPESIQLALDAGCRWIQLRVKDQPQKEVLQQAIRSKKLCDSYQARLIINDFPLVAREVQAHGLHLGLDDMPIRQAREIVGDEMIIGGTANTFDHILLRLDEGADYIGLGPFRFTTTKKNLSPVLGLKGYEEIMIRLSARKKTVPVIAIGGILPADVAQLAGIGVHGVAMSQALLQSENRKELVTLIYETLC